MALIATRHLTPLITAVSLAFTLVACGGGSSSDERRQPLAGAETTVVPSVVGDDLYRFFVISFGAAPGVTYMAQLQDAANSGMSVQAIVNAFTTKAQFKQTYPDSLTNQAFAQSLVENVVAGSASSSAKAEAIRDIVDALSLPSWTRGDIVYAIFNNLAKKPSNDPQWGAMAKKMANQVTYAKYFTETMKVDSTEITTLRAVVKDVNENTPTTGDLRSAILIATGSGTTAFALSSAAGAEGAAMLADHSCDGTGASPALSWTNPPTGTQEYAVLMKTLPGDGTTKFNWVLWGIPGGIMALPRDSYGVGLRGVGSDGPMAAYQPPCSQGTGLKTYTFTVYALSGSPTLSKPTAQVTGDDLLAAMSGLTLGSATLNLTYTRTASSPGYATNCQNIRNSLGASTSGRASVACDGTYAYVGSGSFPTHAMMDGITATNLQVPLEQNFYGSRGWKIPLNPSIAAATTTAVDGPIGVAINGVPIFNPCKQGGCQNGDTKALGELDICNGHAGRADDYHYHAAPVCLMAGKAASYWDTHPIGWALDGFAIYGYRDADGQTAARDNVCGGNTQPVSNGPAGYKYHVTDVSPYVLSCFRGTPSPDLAGQSAKFSPLRQAPVQPFAVSGMTLKTDPSDGYQVLEFTSARTFTTNETGNDSYVNAPGTYRIRYKPLTGSELSAVLAQAAHKGKTACWNFQFQNVSGTATQPTLAYCR